jgi:hypothetical protein
MIKGTPACRNIHTQNVIHNHSLGDQQHCSQKYMSWGSNREGGTTNLLNPEECNMEENC